MPKPQLDRKLQSERAHRQQTSCEVQKSVLCGAYDLLPDTSRLRSRGPMSSKPRLLLKPPACTTLTTFQEVGMNTSLASCLNGHRG